ncbi:putative uncharacterized protein [Corynebacterium casei UCMA 3821]|uniref:Uncharacterized protein n=1 Tax=Corynebacterium casei UCMA 3821 TaxID=1110505 RepID=G7HZU1_9CORY|nr:putative uncharacterized protein [Corynebacterium casei UCMA 3821]
MSVEEIVFFRHICNATTSMNTVFELVLNSDRSADRQ